MRSAIVHRGWMDSRIILSRSWILWLIVCGLSSTSTENFDNDQKSEMVSDLQKIYPWFSIKYSPAFLLLLQCGQIHIFLHRFLNAHIIWLGKCRHCDYCFNISTTSKSINRFIKLKQKNWKRKWKWKWDRKKEQQGRPLIFIAATIRLCAI